MHKHGIALPCVGELAGRITLEIGGSTYRANGRREIFSAVDGARGRFLSQYAVINNPNGESIERQVIRRPGRS